MKSHKFHIIATEVFTFGLFEDPEYVELEIQRDGKFYKKLCPQPFFSIGMPVVTIEEQVERLAARLGGATVEWRKTFTDPDD